MSRLNFYKTYFVIFTQLFCLSVDCEDPDVPSNGMIDTPSGTTVGHPAIYNCSSDYILNGQETRWCLISGMWSGIAPTCDPVGRYTILKQRIPRNKVYLVNSMADIINHFKHSVFMGNRQTLQIQIKHHTMWCLITIFTVCLQTDIPAKYSSVCYC